VDRSSGLASHGAGVAAEILALDEPLSALDVSIQAGIINLLLDLQVQFGLSYLFVSHDLSVVKHLRTRCGDVPRTIVEQGDGDQVFTNPQHEYTAAAGRRSAGKPMSPVANIGWVRRPPLVRNLACWRWWLSSASPAAQTGIRISRGAGHAGRTPVTSTHGPATLRDGGNLRLPLGSFPDNFNELNIDGNTADTAISSRRHCRGLLSPGRRDAETQHDYFTGAELTGTNPQVVTYTSIRKRPGTTAPHLAGGPQVGGRRMQRRTSAF